MGLITLTCALNEGNAVDFFPVRGAHNLPLCGSIWSCQPFHHHVRDHIGISAKAQVINASCIVGFPAGCHDYGPHLEVEAFRFHVQINGVVFAHIDTFGAGTKLAGRIVNDVLHGEGHLMGEINGLGCAYTEVKGIRSVYRTDGNTGITGGAAIVNIAGLLSYRDVEVSWLP